MMATATSAVVPPGGRVLDEIATGGKVVTVVLLDLDQGSRRIEVAALRYGGYEVTTARTVDQAVSLLRAHRSAAVLVDPAHCDVTQLVADLRARTDLPIIVVGEEVGEPDIVAALDAGADDYVTKPLHVEELLARLRAAMRRMRYAAGVAPIVTDDFTINLEARRIFSAEGQEIFLTGVEFRMVEVLLRHPGHLVSRQQLLREVWGERGLENLNYLRVFSNRIRRKLEPDPAHPRYLHTVNGLGLVFDLGDGSFADNLQGQP
jgi:two-component system KDP operon response regulator KdpE